MELRGALVLLFAAGCGGAPFELGAAQADPPAIDGALDASDTPDAVGGPDAGHDAHLGFKPPPDAGVIDAIDARTPDAAIDAPPTDAPPVDAQTPDAPTDLDACAAPAWDCSGTHITAHNFCVIYLSPDGGTAGLMAEGNAGVPHGGAARLGSEEWPRREARRPDG
jgi:hypothetical protein